MEEANPDAMGPDLTLGIAVDELADGGMLAGHVGEEAVLLARRGNEFFAIGATCSHYGGPLAQGIVVDDTVRCPWHHACFSLRTGEALRAPAFSAVACWSTELRDGKVFVRGKKEEAAPKAKVSEPGARTPQRIVIIGGGAAGFAAAERLRREQYQGGIVMLSSDDAPPVDRPNLSKDYLAGNAPEDWIPLRPDSFYPEHGIELRLGTSVKGIDAAAREVASGRCEQGALRPAAARDRRRAGPATAAGYGPAARVHVALACRLPSDHLAGQLGAASRRDGRELHRARSRRVAPRARNRGPRGGAGKTADGAHPGTRDGRLRSRAARRAWRDLPPRRHSRRDRRSNECS